MERKIDFGNPQVARTLTKGIEKANQEPLKANNLDALKLVGEFLLFLVQESLDKPFKHISRLRF